MAVASSTKISLGKGGEFRAVSTAGTGTAPAATATFVQFPYQTEKVTVTARNLSTAVSVFVAFNPWLTVLMTTDNMESVIDYSKAAQDNSTDTDIDLSSMDTRANGTILLVGADIQYRGVYFDVDATNDADTSTVSASYWNGSIWVDTGANVTGIRTTRVWDKDGIVTWTVPTAWKPASIEKLYPLFTTKTYFYEPALYWTRWELNAAITDSSVTLNSMSAANRSTNYGEILDGQMVSKNIHHGFGGTGCVEVLGNAGTSNIHINAYTSGKFE